MCIILVACTAAAAGVAFVAGNVVFFMQLTYDQYRPGTRAWESPKSACSAASGFLFSQVRPGATGAYGQFFLRACELVLNRDC